MANSADDKLTVFFFFFSHQKIGFDISYNLLPKKTDLHEMLKPMFWEKLEKIFQNVN